jgi:hypothetical protein
MGGQGRHTPDSVRRKTERFLCQEKARCLHQAECRRCELGHHCGEHGAGCHLACGPQQGYGRPVTFQVFRRKVPSWYLEAGLGVPADQVQFEGAVFTDGTCVIRWCTKVPSVATFPSFRQMMAVHGHPEYETDIRWFTDGEEPEQ